jgi:hypothetical protein
VKRTYEESPPEPEGPLTLAGVIDPHRAHVEAQDQLAKDLRARIGKEEAIENFGLKERREVCRMKRHLEAIHLISLADFDARANMYRARLSELGEQKCAELYRSEVLGLGIQHSPIEMEMCVRCQRRFIKLTEVAHLYCDECGLTVKYMDATSCSVSFSESVDFNSSSWHRVNHLNEFLQKLSAKESSRVKPDVYRHVMRHILVEQKVTRSVDIEFGHVRLALKALNFTDLYDQQMQIYCGITCRKPIRFEPHFIEKVRLMFIAIQASYERHCPSTRVNFFNYVFILFKFSHLLGFYHLLPYFPLLKGLTHLDAQEDIFRKVCDDLGWPKLEIPVQYLRWHADKVRQRDVEGGSLTQLLAKSLH